MWAYQSDDEPTVRQLFRTTPEKLWKALFKPRKSWPAKEEDSGLSADNPPTQVWYNFNSLTLFLWQKARTPFSPHSQKWLSKVARVYCPFPQPKDPRSEFLAAMLVVAPYSATEKKEKKKKAREGLRIRDQLDAASVETHAS